jgi:hypothetical protein
MSGLLTNNMNQTALPLTGNELLPLDTQLAGTTPETYAASVDQIANYARAASQNAANFRNILDGGDATTNPWQRGTSFSTIVGTLTYTADRWFAIGGTSTNIAVSRATLTAGALPGFAYAFQFGRATGATGTSVCKFAQVVETLDSYRLQGQYVLLSFYALAGAGYNTATGAGVTAPLNVNIYTTFGGSADQSATNMLAGSWTNQATGNSVAAGVVGAISAVNLTSAFTRYYVLAKVPSNATQVGVQFSYTPLGTAVANEYVQLAGIQLEIVSPNATQALAANYASTFEFRDVQVELEIAQRYFWQSNEPASGVVVGAGMNTTANIQVFYMATPVQMRIAPTVTVTAGTYKTNQASVATATTITPGSTHTQNAITINGNSAGTQGQGTLLQGGGGSGLIAVSADYV